MKKIFFYIIYIIIISVSSFLFFEGGIRFWKYFSNESLSSKLQRTIFSSPPLLIKNCIIQGETALGDIIRPSFSPDIVYELKPNLETCYFKKPLIINGQGLRANKNYQKPKPKNIYRILILGDSQTFGQGVSYEETFGYYLEKKLRNSIDHKEIEVINMGIPGYNTAMEAAYFKKYGLEYEPDCILILFIGNDLALPWFMLKEPEILTTERLYSLEYINHLISRYQQNKKWFEDVPEMYSAYVDDKDRKRVPAQYQHMVGLSGYKQSLKSIANSASSRKIPIINLADYGFLNDRVDVSELINYQENLGILVPPFKIPSGEKYSISKEDHHLNAKGHKEIGKQIFKIFIKNILKGD